MLKELAPPETNAGVGELLRVLADPEPMTVEELATLRAQAVYLYDAFPTNVVLVGGNALRLWLDRLNLPVPRQISGDFDLVTWGGRPPDPGIDTLRGGPASMPLDIFNTWEPQKYPFFAEVDLDGRSIPLATLPRLLFAKSHSIVHENPNPQDVAKDHFYYGVLRQLVEIEQMDAFLDAYREHMPHHIQIDELCLELLEHDGLVSSIRQWDQNKALNA